VIRVVSADGFQILSEHFETKSDPRGVFKVSDRIISELVNRVGPEQPQFEKQQLTARPSMFSVNPTSNPLEAANHRPYP